MTALLDTGVSMVSCAWRDRYLNIQPLSEIVEEMDELKVYAVNGEPIPFKGWVPIVISLLGKFPNGETIGWF